MMGVFIQCDRWNDLKRENNQKKKNNNNAEKEVVESSKTTTLTTTIHNNDERSANAKNVPVDLRAVCLVRAIFVF